MRLIATLENIHPLRAGLVLQRYSLATLTVRLVITTLKNDWYSVSWIGSKARAMACKHSYRRSSLWMGHS